MTQRTLEEIAGNFALFDDWEGRYRYLIDLGRKLPGMDVAQKTDENIVRGCTSQVWMTAEIKNNVFHFNADSDAHIVRGLIALLMAAYQDLPLMEIGSINVEKVFREIGLDEHLSPNRRNGFYAMVERIQNLANS